MSGYTEDYRDMKHAHFLNTWVPERVGVPTAEQYRYTLARARAAEDELKKIRSALNVLQSSNNRSL